MAEIDAGDIVRSRRLGFEMIVIGRADQDSDQQMPPSVFCVWERDHFLHEEVFEIIELELVRAERRRIPRGGELVIPCA